MSGEHLPRPFGPYLLLDRLGEGSMGTVHLARPLKPREGVRVLVVKRLQPAIQESAEQRARARHEAEIAVAVSSDHVVRVLEVGSVDDTPFIAMEHVLGTTIGGVIGACRREEKALPLPVLSRIFAGALEGLEALHSAVHPESGVPLGVVHRDLSPNNLMISAADARCVLIDLGLGRSTIQEWRTRTGLVMGTPGYMSPEQARGERTDARSDLYALSILLWEALTLGRYVERGELPAMMEMMRDPRSRWSESMGGVPPAVVELVRRALSPEPADRFESAALMRAALVEAVLPADAASAIAAMPRELGEAWARARAKIERLVGDAFSGGAPDEEKTKIIAQRAAATVSATLLPPTVRVTVEPRGRALPLLPVIVFGAVLSVTAVTTSHLLSEPAVPAVRVVPAVEAPVAPVQVHVPVQVPVPVASVPVPAHAPEAIAVPRTASVAERSAPVDSPRPPPGRAARKTPVVAAPPVAEPPSAETLRARAIGLAKETAALPRTDRSTTLLVKVNRLLTLPELRESEVRSLELELQRLRAE